MERLTKWDYFYSTFGSKPFVVYKSAQRHAESPSVGSSIYKKEIYRKIDSIKHTLSRERDDRLKVEKINAKLHAELKEARSSVKKYFKGYEKERKAREEIEDVCEDLAKEIEHEKTEVETLKTESLKMREEVEEEKKMLQMAEVWREERVQMKLVDAKIALENKYSQLNHLQAEIEAFLRTHKDDWDAINRAEFLIKATKQSSQKLVRGESSNLLEEPVKRNLNEPVSCDSSQGSVRSVNGALKENNRGENSNGNSTFKNEIVNAKMGCELSEVSSTATKNSRNNKESTSVNKFRGNNGCSRKSGAEMQRKKRRNGQKARTFCTSNKEENNVGTVNRENGFVF